MKHIILSTLLCCTVSTIAMAQTTAPAPTSPVQGVIIQRGNLVSGEGQALLALFVKDVLPKELVLTAEPTIAEQGRGYVVTVPDGTLQDEAKTPVSGYQVVFNRISNFNGYSAFEADMTDVSQISPTLGEMMKQNNVTVDKFSYKISFVPALNMTIGQGTNIDNLVLKDEGKDVLIINKILEKGSVTALPDQMAKVERATGVAQLSLNLPLGSIGMDRLTSLVEIPSIATSALSIQDIWSAKEASFKSNITNLSVVSMFLPVQEVHTNIDFNGGFKQSEEPHHVDVTLNCEIKDIAVAQNLPAFEGKLPTSVTLNAILPNLDVKQFQQIVQLKQEIADEATSEERRSVAQEELDNTIKQLSKNTVLQVKKAAIDADKYSISFDGVLDATTETAKGKLTVVNFDFISPKGQIDKKACADARQKADTLLEQLAQANDNALFEQAMIAQTQASELCEAEPGLLEFLRPYLASARHSVNTKGQTVDVFDLEYNQKGMHVNGQRVVFEEEATPDETQPVDVVTDVETDTVLIP